MERKPSQQGHQKMSPRSQLILTRRRIAMKIRMMNRNLKRVGADDPNTFQYRQLQLYLCHLQKPKKYPRYNSTSYLKMTSLALSDTSDREL